MEKGWIDISVPVRNGMPHWPTDAAPKIEWKLRIDRGDVCNVSALTINSHTGTHMDAPLHFIREGQSLDRMPLDATLGPARIIEIKDKESIKPDELRPHRIKRGERILFKTRNSTRCWKTDTFDEDFIFISKEAAEYLAKLKIRTVGVDYLSVGGFKKDGVETHQALLSTGIWIIEGLNLSKVKPGRYDLVCLPLKVLGSEGAPARAVLRKR